MRRVDPALLLILLGTIRLSAHSGADHAADLKEFFNRSCAACHGEDGSGRGPNGQRLGGKDLANPRWQVRTRDSQMAEIILRGKGPMPAFGSLMSETEALKLVSEVIRPMAAKKH